MAYSTMPAGSPTTVSHKAPGSPKRILHLFLSLGKALLNHNGSLCNISLLEISLDFIALLTCFSIDILHAIIAATKMTDLHIMCSLTVSFSGQIIPIPPQDPMAET